LTRDDRPSPVHAFGAEAEPRRTPRECEAPDRGDLENEAPEARVGRQAEAPDAGEGRMGLIEQEFTHGRSQS
jgi:hypothetical protein